MKSLGSFFFQWLTKTNKQPDPTTAENIQGNVNKNKSPLGFPYFIAVTQCLPTNGSNLSSETIF